MARLKSALIVDFDNIFAAVGSPFAANVAKWTRWLEDGAFAENQSRREFVTKRVYWNLQHDIHRSTFQSENFQTYICQAYAKYKKASGKSSADIVMTMDAIELAGGSQKLDEVIFLTTDSDFVPVVNRLQRAGLRVVTGGKETDPTYHLYTEHADAAIHMAAIKAACDYEPVKRKWYSFRRPEVPIADLEFSKERRSALTRKLRNAVDEQKNADDKEHAQLRRAAAIIAELGERTPDQALGKKKIIRALEQVDGFSAEARKGLKPWLGLRSYAGMMKALAKVDERIEVRIRKKKVALVVFRVPQCEIETKATVRETTPRAQWTDAPVSITG